MSSYTPKQIEEDSRSSEGIGEGELDEEGFFSKDEESSVPQTWSPFEDLDDSGHFTASPDGERALSGSSRSHSPCFPTFTSNTTFQMQQHDINSNAYLFHQQSPLPQANKPLISPRSVMTVKVPQLTNSTSAHAPTLNAGNENYRVPEMLNTDPFLREPPKTLNFSSVLHTSSQNPSHAFSPINSNGGMSPESGGESEESSTYLRGILENFNSLYMEKLKMFDDLVAEGNEEQRLMMMEKKSNMLETWAKDVCVQNMVLVHTVEELEKEANRKVTALQRKITESTQAAKEHMTMIKKYEEQVKILLKNHSDTEEKNLVLKIDLEKLRNECRRVKDRMNFLLKDNESLVTLVCRIRDMGVWDVSGLELQRASFDQIFGLYPNLMGGEVQTVFTREKARRVQDTEEKMSHLEKQLANLQEAKQESESQLLHKDRKIEQLETEIKNISNRAQYCEKECNDYKKSLMETQEKLLEATRKLTSSPKYSKPVPGVSEMTQLIQELRDVKSQLNMAVEEKQTAKEESNHVKRELGERLKEMHDIQNMFQSLATEVVSSRAAFQQVQEKEVQLQSLKSEVQTYQTRCANAEDTIRKKEKEIKQLQQQMNEIHKRSKKPSNPTSSISMKEGTPVTSENGESGMLKFYETNLRNIATPTKIPKKVGIKVPIRHRSEGPVKTKAATVNSSSIPKPRGTSQNHPGQGRPIWNKNFNKKTSGILQRPPPDLPKVSKCVDSNLTRSQASFKMTSDEGIDTLSHDCKEVYSKLTELGERLSSEQAFCSNLNLTTSTLESTPAKDNFANLFKLPMIPEKIGEDFHLTTAVKQSHAIHPNATNENVLEKKKLPVVNKSATSFSKRKAGTKKVENPLLKNLIQNPRGPTPRLNELISAVVETSKQLLGTEAEVPLHENKDIQAVTITAAHYRKKAKPKHETEARRVKSSDKNAETNRGASAEEPPTIPTKFHSSTGLNIDMGDEELVMYEPPQNVQEFLAGLPQASQEDIVKNWIKKASSNSIDVDKGNGVKKINKAKVPLVTSGRRPSVKVMKHLATRRWPKRKSSKESGGGGDKVGDLNAEMFELEDEWGKVFANLECKVDGAAVAKDKVEKVITASVPSLQPQVTHSTDSIPGSSAEESSMQSKEATKQQHPVEQTCEIKCQQQESIQELLDRLANEKREMEERFRRELQDKDIELKMQKTSTCEFCASPGAYLGITCNESLICDNGPVSPQQYAGCLNRRETADLISSYEKRKSYMLSELGSLKTYCSRLDQSALQIDSRIQEAIDLISNSAIPAIIDAKPNVPNSAGDASICDEGFYSARGDFSRSLENSNMSVRSTPLKTRPANPSAASNDKNCSQYKTDKESPREVTRHAYSHLRSRFEDLKMSVPYNNKKFNQAEESSHLMVAKIQTFGKQVSDVSGSSPAVASAAGNSFDANKNVESVETREKEDKEISYLFSPMQKLEQMKKAFDTNQQLLTLREQKLATLLESISSYEKFVNEIWSFAGNIIPVNNDTRQDLNQKLGHLCECVKQALADNGLMCKKLEALQQILETANRENALLSETVTSLNNHIDALSQHNDKLLHQFDRKGRQKRCKSPLTVSNQSSPRSDISERVENESSSFVVDTRASGDRSCQMNTFFASSSVVPVLLEERNDDICPNSPCYHQHHHHCSRKSEETQIMTSSVEAPCADSFGNGSVRGPGTPNGGDHCTSEYVQNLKQLTKCLLDLKMNVYKAPLSSSCPASSTNSPNFSQSFGSNEFGRHRIDAFVRENPVDSNNTSATQQSLDYYFEGSLDVV